MFLPNKHSFLLARPVILNPVRSKTPKASADAQEHRTSNGVNPHHLYIGVGVKRVIQSGLQESACGESACPEPVEGVESATSLPSSSSSACPEPSREDSVRKMFLPNSYSFLLIRRQNAESDLSSATETATAAISHEQSAAGPPASSGEVAVGDKNKRTFLKVAGIAGAGIAASLLLPKKAEALIMGSSPTTGVVGVKNAANTRINPATEETLGTVLKTTDLTFDAGSVAVKVTSLPAGSSSFSDSAGVARSGLVDIDRHVQVDVLSSALPTTASTETTLQTISFGGFKFTLRLDTVGSIDYVGEASIGTATSAASWRIKRVDSTTGIIIQWAGTGVFNQIWDNRASLSYS